MGAEAGYILGKARQPFREAAVLFEEPAVSLAEEFGEI
jgi:hypothetical protein